jgi:hypothetical protein
VVALAADAGAGVVESRAAVADMDARGVIRVDQAGLVIGSWGLNVLPDRHELWVGGRRFWTWCAMDAAGILGALAADGRIRSRNPLSGEMVEVMFRAGRPEPTAAVVFLANRGPCASVYEDWCSLVNLFEDATAAGSWVERTGSAGECRRMDELTRRAAETWRPLVGGLTPDERVDAASGLRERAGFAGSLFVVRYLPAAPVGHALVLCPPILGDQALHYRREVLLARALGARGVEVVRFHPRGSGNSHGDPLESTFETLVADARAAAGLVQADRTAFLGTRVGALVAAAARPGAPLLLWDAIDGADFWREAFRARRIRGLVDGAGHGGPIDDAEAQLDSVGSIDVLGYRVGRPLYESLLSRTLAGELGSAERRVLRLDNGGRWWFNPEPSLDEVEPMADLIAAWLPS